MSNPILNNNRFSPQEAVLEGEPMTMQGTVGKIFMLFACLIAGSAISLYYLFTNPSIAMILLPVGAIIGFILVLATCFNVRIAKYTAAPYAFAEGLVLGSFSALFEAQYHGIVAQAIIATFSVLFIMLMLYKAKMITYTEKLRSVILTGLLSIGAIYLIQIVASLFGRSIPAIFDAGPIGILFSLIVVGFAAVSLIQDFYFIEEASINMLPKDYEWYGAMGLMITLVWLYMEILRLLAKLNSRR
jgi:uncharacterized YccA/Bax inhibitor family protein